MDLAGILFSFFGGLGLFLYGIKGMSEGLQATAGDRMRLIIERGTKNPVRGIITGALVTALIQSSSGTTVLAVGLVNAGLLPLHQAIGVIMGANIGTTITAYLIGFDLKAYALPIIAVGVFLMFFTKKKKKLNHIGQIFFGFGLLFYGMDVMGSGLKPLRNSEFFINMMANVEGHPIFGVLIGTVFTGLVQSSSATTGILQELAYQGVVSYGQSVPILLGNNIGTTVTALLAGLGASIAARRAAMAHFLFNVIGTLIFIPLFLAGFFVPLVEGFTNLLYALIPGEQLGWDFLNVRMQIAQTHGVFNISNTIILLPFVGLISFIVSKIIPGEEKNYNIQPEYLEPRFLDNPPVAVANAGRETLRMGRVSIDAFDNSVKFFFEKNEENSTETRKLEDIIDNLEKEITDYIVKATTGKILSEIVAERGHILLHVVGDLERVGDHCENLVELTEYALEHKIGFSERAVEDLREMVDQVRHTLANSLEVLKTEDKVLARQVVESDDIVDQMEKDLRKAHIFRLNEGECSGGAGAVYLDILSNLERIGDHSVNIAEYFLEKGSDKPKLEK